MQKKNHKKEARHHCDYHCFSLFFTVCENHNPQENSYITHDEMLILDVDDDDDDQDLFKNNKGNIPFCMCGMCGV